jgi:hypothetical protein
MRFWIIDRSYDDFFNRLTPYRTFVNKGKRKGRLQSSRPYAKVARRFTLEGGFHEGLALLRVLPPNLIKEPYPVVSLLNISTP